MCTVTLIPLSNNNFVLTSNRDEAPNRDSLAPEFYKYKNEKLLYPKDKVSEGSWIGLGKSNKRLICLLNGGFEIHERQAEYRLSRGIVVKDFLISENIEIAIEDYNLNNIEPFTIVVVEWEKQLKFYELVWDGKQKHFKNLSLKPRIWSSSTLYNNEMRAERQKWFDLFMSKRIISDYDMFEFHTSAGSGNKDYGVIMDRGFVKTTSVTRVEKLNDSVVMRYYDLNNETHHYKMLNDNMTMVHEK